MCYSADPSRLEPTSAVCVNCEEVGVSVFAFGGAWHRSCLALFVSEYNEYLDTIRPLTRYRPYPCPPKDWNKA